MQGPCGSTAWCTRLWWAMIQSRRNRSLWTTICVVTIARYLLEPLSRMLGYLYPHCAGCITGFCRTRFFIPVTSVLGVMPGRRFLFISFPFHYRLCVNYLGKRPSSRFIVTRLIQICGMSKNLCISSQISGILPFFAGEHISNFLVTGWGNGCEYNLIWLI